MLESVKDITLFTDQTTVAMSHNKQLIDTVRKGVLSSTELVNED